MEMILNVAGARYTCRISESESGRGGWSASKQRQSARGSTRWQIAAQQSDRESRMFNIRAWALGACSFLACSMAPMQVSADSLKTIHTFTAIQKGARPRAGLTIDSSGVLYGTTYTGAKDGNGTVFQLTPPGDGSKKWV